ncbi:hypothetical protein ACMHYO_12520 [Allopusillimonas ginsengisoli]|uniref:hypothetical protein n=1 Tax=Allopusillimonas ginsengisoli TaxID=453575 RepID=UPI001485B247
MDWNKYTIKPPGFYSLKLYAGQRHDNIFPVGMCAIEEPSMSINYRIGSQTQKKPLCQ